MAVNNTIILGIESSCDDTSAAILIGTKILSNVTATQLIHEKYGGVVPELASRAHQENILPVVKRAIEEAGITLEDIQALAFTQGPGLLDEFFQACDIWNSIMDISIGSMAQPPVPLLIARDLAKLLRRHRFCFDIKKI